MRVHVAGAIVLTIGGLLAAAPGARAADPAKEIAKFQAIKRGLTPAERKLDSTLAVDLRAKKVKTVDVDIRVRRPEVDLLGRLQKLGANVHYVSKRTGGVRATVDASAIRTIAAWGDVARVANAAQAMTARIGGKTTTKEERAASAEAVRRAALAAITSEGVAAHAVNTVFQRDRVTGTGVKLCALSDGVDSLAASQTTGELPDVDVLPGEEGDGDEGTAMLEILHDVAPGAQLGFATAFTSFDSFADNIRALRFEADCDVIVDDILYFAESPFQDGGIAQAVNDVTADGALYFSSAGNAGNTIDGTAGNYEADFRPGAGTGFLGEAHDFDPGPAVQIANPISDDIANSGVPITLWWADPLGASANDYDLYLLDGNNKIVSVSQDVQDGDDEPFEILGTPAFEAPDDWRVAVVRAKGEPRYFQVSAWRGRFKDAEGLPAWVTPGVTRGHSAAQEAFSIAAAPAATALPFDLEEGDPPNPTGPFPTAFTAAQAPERFTSDGPRRMFFDAAGAPAPQTRAKPSFTAADGVSTSVPDFETFFGTSAAAPHAAAIAALVLSGNPTATAADIREAFTATALDLVPAGVDGRTGRGILRADAILEYTGATPQPLVEAQEPIVNTTTDGDTVLEPGETGTLQLPVKNVGDGNATGVSVVVTTSTAGATITPRTRFYGDVAAGATVARDFTVTLAASYPLGKPVALAVRVTFAGALSPTTKTLSLPVGRPSATTQRFAFAGPPVAIPDRSVPGVSVPIVVSGVGYASDLDVSIDGSPCSATQGSTTVGIDHSFVGDLTGTLTGPSEQTAVVFQRRGGSGNNLCQVVFDDSAEEPFSSVVSADAPFTGRWRPETPLAPLLSTAVDGTWTFKVVDGAAADTGSIRALSLLIRGFEQG